METTDNTLSKASENQVQRDENGRLLPGSSLNPTGLNKGAKHMRTIYEDYLKERYMVKKKVLKELEDGTITEEEVEVALTRFDAIVEAQFKKAVEKGDGLLMMYIVDQAIGKATQTTKIEGSVPVRGFELDPKLEEKVDDQFAVEEKVALPTQEETHADSTQSFSITEEDTKNNEGGTQAA
jgi:hypothetical protein